MSQPKLASRECSTAGSRFRRSCTSLDSGNIGERDVHLPRLIAPRDRQRHRFSDADLFKNSRKIGYVVDRLPIRGGDYVFDVARWSLL
jgi:hypothetical protein